MAGATCRFLCFCACFMLSLFSYVGEAVCGGVGVGGSAASAIAAVATSAMVAYPLGIKHPSRC